MKSRKHHNNNGGKTIKTGLAELRVSRMAKKLGIPFDGETKFHFPIKSKMRKKGMKNV